MALGTQVVNLIGLHLLQDAGEVGAVGKVTVMQIEPTVLGMGILVDVIYALGVKRRSTALDAVNFVAHVKQKLCKVGAVLAGHAGDKCFFQNTRISIEPSVCAG